MTGPREAQRRDDVATAAATPAALESMTRERRWVVGTLAIAMTVVVAGAIASLHAIAQTREARHWVDHTHRVLTTIADARDGLHAAASTTRAFLLTGDARFTVDVAALRSETSARIGELRSLTADMPPQQERIARIAPLIAERFATCVRQIATARSGAPADGAAMIPRGAELDARIGALLDDLRAREDALLSQRDARSAASARNTSIFLLLTAATAVATGFAAGPLVLLQMRRRERAELRLVASHGHLEREVAARTRELSESRERLAMAQAIAGVGTFDWRLDTGRVIWSPELEALFGLPRGGFAGSYDDWRHLVLPEDLPAVEATARDAIAGLRRLDVEFRVRRADDGAVRWIRAVGSPVGPGRFLGVNIDVTDAKLAVDALAASERRYRFLAETMPEIVWTATPDGGLDYINQVFAEFIGEPIDAHLGESWTRALHPDDAPAARERWGRSIATGEDYVAEFRIRRADGAWRWHLARARAQRDDRGAIISWYGTCTDIQDQKERAVVLEREVAERTRELRAANEELESFSYSVSHDLRTPLRAIEGFSDALDEDQGARLDATGHDHLRRIRAAARRMGEIIDALLKLSRLGRSRLALAPVDVGAMAREVMAELGRQEPERRIATRVGDCAVMADAALLRTALENLLGNTWKFTRDTTAPRIEVSCAPAPDGMAAIRVADNGAGFPADAGAKLFHAFKRFHDPARFPGTGIGLATVRRIVERHGGAIRAEGAPGRGASFIVTLPAASPAPTDEPVEVG